GSLGAGRVDRAEPDGWVERVRAEPIAGESGTEARAVTIELKQAGTMVEPTVVLCRCRGADLRVPIWPQRGRYDVPGASVERNDDGWVVRVEAPGPPTQVEVDPDHALL